MHLKSLSDTELLRDTKRYALEEKNFGILVLHRIREIDARKLFAELGHASLHMYCMKELGLSESTAGRRIQAMRLLRELPEYEQKLKEGVIHEGSLSSVQTFFNRERKKKKKLYSKQEKLDLLKAAEGKSARNLEKLLASISPESARQENARPINEEETEIRFTVGKAFMEKLDQLRNLLGHQLSDQQYATLFEELADIVLKKLEPKPPTLEKSSSSETRYVSPKLKNAVWHRDQGRCTYTTSDGRRCPSRYALQYEHIVPFGKGGKTNMENLKLLCLAHNQLAAIQEFGLDKMQTFWPK
jgi:hypothetical protein